MAAWFNLLLAKADKQLVQPNVLNIPVDFVAKLIKLPRPVVYTGGLFIICTSILLSNTNGLFYTMGLVAILAQLSVTGIKDLKVYGNNWQKYLPLFCGVILMELYYVPIMSTNVYQTYWAIRTISLLWTVLALAFDHAIGTLYASESETCK